MQASSATAVSGLAPPRRASAGRRAGGRFVRAGQPVAERRNPAAAEGVAFPRCLAIRRCACTWSPGFRWSRCTRRSSWPREGRRRPPSGRRLLSVLPYALLGLLVLRVPRRLPWQRRAAGPLLRGSARADRGLRAWPRRAGVIASWSLDSFLTTGHAGLRFEPLNVAWQAVIGGLIYLVIAGAGVRLAERPARARAGGARGPGRRPARPGRAGGAPQPAQSPLPAEHAPRRPRPGASRPRAGGAGARAPRRGPALRLEDAPRVPGPGRARGRVGVRAAATWRSKASAWRSGSSCAWRRTRRSCGAWCRRSFCSRWSRTRSSTRSPRARRAASSRSRRGGGATSCSWRSATTGRACPRRSRLPAPAWVCVCSASGSRCSTPGDASLSLQAAEGGGVRATIDLPLDRGAGLGAHVTTPTVRAAIAEDEPQARRTLRAYLEGVDWIELAGEAQRRGGRGAAGRRARTRPACSWTCACRS